MSRDRYGEFARATNNPDIEMGRMQSGNGGYDAGDLGSANYDSFWRETEAIDKMIGDMKYNIVELEKTYKHSLASYEEQQIHSDSQTIDRLIDDMNRLSSSIRGRLKDMDASARSANDRVKVNRTLALSKRFRDVVAEYRNVQNTYDRRMRDQLARQYRIVRPNASQAEIEQAVSEPSAGIFRQELLQSSRTNRANAVLTEVEDRHRNVQNIVRSINELNQLFAELNDMVTSQGQLVDAIEQHTEQVVVDTREANVHLSKGIKSAKSWRRGKWICFFVTLIILIVVVLIILWQVGVLTPKPSNNNGSG